MLSNGYHFILLFILSYCNDPCYGVNVENKQKSSKCEIDLHSPAITMSPGFLSGSLPYVGHNACTEAGTCKNIPLICPTSSCCTSNRNISFPASPGFSRCGCWDSKRKTCKPIQSFRLGWETCNSDNAIHEKSDFELTTAASMGEICKENGTTVEFGADEITKTAYVRVNFNLCSQKSRSIEETPVHVPVNYMGNTEIAGLPEFGNIKRNIRWADLKHKFSRDSIEELLEILSNQGQRHNIESTNKCGNFSGNELALISMTPDVLTGSVPDFLSQYSEVCGIYGDCKANACETTGCCLMSRDGNFSGCDCMASKGNCLLDYKVFKVGGQACTTSGERVRTDLKIKIPSNDLSECTRYSASPSIQFTLNEIGNVEITVETKQCILSNVNKKYLQVELKVSAEINIDQFLTVIKKLY